MLLLWDIDGTVLRAGPLAREAFATAVHRATGTHPGAHGIAMSGKTDPQIALEILETMGLDPAAAAEGLAGILRHLEDELAGSPERLRENGRLLPGVAALLARLDGDPRVVQTVLTGNIAANAALKLAVFGVDRWFDLEIGAYGSDHHDRCELVPVARRRFVQRYGREPDEVWVVGDTPNDLACARAGGARCLLVATGRVPYETLAALPADAVLHDLGDLEAVTALLR
ncbi:MAG: HAD family hydrolase [Egibacteraceae bacterium]